MASKRLLPLAAMEKILKQAGAERVSDKAKSELKNALEEKADEIAAPTVPYWGIKTKLRIVFTDAPAKVAYIINLVFPIDIKVIPFKPTKAWKINSTL